MSQINDQVLVNTRTGYVKEQSEPSMQKFVWSYEISIHNKSNNIIQLLSRFWRITDLSGKVEEIHGTGVVGLQPIIKPNKIFTYTSFCQLMTPQGTMEGHYVMQDLEENLFNVEIPKFILSAPSSITQAFRSKLH